MALSTLVDLVKIAVSNSGSGLLNLGAAVPGFRGIEALSDGLTYSYSIQQGANFEVGTGVFLSTGNRFVRTPNFSSNGGATINLAAGGVIVFTARAADFAQIPIGTQALALLAGNGGADLIGTANGLTVQQLLDSFILFNDDLRLTADTTMTRDFLGRRSRLLGTTVNCAAALPPVEPSDAGLVGVLLSVDNSCTKYWTISAASGSGLYIDGASSRLMHAGEWAFLVFDAMYDAAGTLTGYQWTKWAGKTIPFTGYIQATGAQGGITPAGNWTALTGMTDAGGDTRQLAGTPAGLTPWAVGGSFIAPRRGSYAFDLLVPIGSIVMPAPNYAVPVGTEQGATLFAGLGYSGTDPSNTGSLTSERVFYNEALRSVVYSEEKLLGTNDAVKPWVRALAPLTSIAISYSSPSTLARLSFAEIPTW